MTAPCFNLSLAALLLLSARSPPRRCRPRSTNGRDSSGAISPDSAGTCLSVTRRGGSVSWFWAAAPPGASTARGRGRTTSWPSTSRRGAGRTAFLGARTGGRASACARPPPGRTNVSAFAIPKATLVPTGPSTARSPWAPSTTGIPTPTTFVFYAGGHTFRYDPAGHSWADLAPKTNPEKELGGILLWGSMCYDRHNKRFLLFGGGNVQSERGDPGTWTFTPATNTWEAAEARSPTAAAGQLAPGVRPGGEEGNPVRRRRAQPPVG